MPGSQAYKAATAYYYSDSGTQKVKEAVDLSAGDFWASVYGDPDPALNMPLKIDMLPNPTTGVLDYPNWNEFGRPPENPRVRAHAFPRRPESPGARGAVRQQPRRRRRRPYPGARLQLHGRLQQVKPKPNVTVEVQALAMEGLTGDELADEPPIPIGNIPSGGP